MKILKENMNYPYEGYFWIIDDSVVGIIFNYIFYYRI